MDFERLISTLNDYIIVASVIAIRKSINCAALILSTKLVRENRAHYGSALVFHLGAGLKFVYNSADY